MSHKINHNNAVQSLKEMIETEKWQCHDQDMTEK